MPWPLSQDYNEAIQDPLHNFSDAELKTGEVVSNALGIPMPRSGNFADVYEVRCPSGSRWAVKCFTREVFGLSERYAEISKYLRLAHLPFMVDFTYLQQGIRVRGQWYPILKMQWVEGFVLNEFVRDNLDKKPILQALGQIWLRMAKRLRESYLAHCDLQHGNVLFVPGPTANSLAVKLIDYDGMCVPSLAGTKSGEVGHPAYQHPERLRTGAYDQEVDRFSLLSIATALHCLTIAGRSLWERYDNGDNLLFRQSDFQAPAQSPLFQELLAIHDPQALMLVKELHRACQGRLDAVPLLTDLLPEAPSAAAPKSSATMKRTSIVKTAATQASPTAGTTATDSPWDLKGEEKPHSHRHRKGGMARWVVGVGLAGMVLAGGLVGWSIWRESDKPKDTPRVAQNKPPVKPSTHKEPSNAPTTSKKKPEEDPAKEVDPVVSPSPEPKPPENVSSNPDTPDPETPKPVVPDANALNTASWEVVRSPGKQPQAYQDALAKAEKASGLAPADGNILNTFGVACYRTGAYARAVETLERSMPLNEKKQGSILPADLAFLAMAHHQLGHTEQAGKYLESLLLPLKKNRDAIAVEAMEFVQEAEDLIEPGKRQGRLALDTDSVKKAYDKALQAARRRVTTAFGTAAKQLVATKMDANERQRQINFLAIDLQAFKLKGQLPWSGSMRTAAMEYLRELISVTDRLASDRVYLRRRYRRPQESDTKVEKLLASFDSLLAPKLIGTWACKGENFQGSFVWKLYTNGKVNDPNGDSTWSLEQKGLTLRIHNPTAPGGVWIDSCDIGAAGQSFKAKNQLNGRYTGNRAR